MSGTAFKAIATLICLCVLSGHAFADKPLTLKQLEDLDFTPAGAKSGESQGEQLKIQAIKDAALQAGSQHGFATRMRELKKILESRSSQIGQVFDFSTLMKLASKGQQQMFFLPPVISEAEDVKRLSADQNTVRVSGRYYEIEQPARLTLRPPNWRQYLLFDQDLYLSVPPKPLIPKTDAEKAVWRKYVKRGWVAGRKQAESEMSYRISRLAQDYDGMLRYMQLVMSGQIKPPFIAIMKKNVVGNGKSMRLDERVYKISIPAQLIKNPAKWNPIYGSGTSNLLYPAETQLIKAKSNGSNR